MNTVRDDDLGVAALAVCETLLDQLVVAGILDAEARKQVLQSAISNIAVPKPNAAAAIKHIFHRYLA